MLELILERNVACIQSRENSKNVNEVKKNKEDNKQ